MDEKRSLFRGLWRRAQLVFVGIGCFILEDSDCIIEAGDLHDIPPGDIEDTLLTVPGFIFFLFLASLSISQDVLLWAFRKKEFKMLESSPPNPWVNWWEKFAFDEIEINRRERAVFYKWFLATERTFGRFSFTPTLTDNARVTIQENLDEIKEEILIMKLARIE